MKPKSNRPMGEREKWRQFRELDDAFAQALRELDDPAVRRDSPMDPPVRRLSAQASEPPLREPTFEERLKALMREYAQPEESVAHLLRTLQTHGHIA